MKFLLEGLRSNFRFVVHWNPWFNRGSGMNVGGDAGVNAFNDGNGHANGDVSFRVVPLYYDFNCY